MSAPTAAERAQVIAGLRELADLLEAHPDLPVTKYPVFGVHAGSVDTGIDETDDDAGHGIVDQAAVILGTGTADSHGHYTTCWLSRGEERFEGDDRWRVRYEVSRISNAATADHEARRSYDSNIDTGGAR